MHIQNVVEYEYVVKYEHVVEPGVAQYEHVVEDTNTCCRERTCWLAWWYKHVKYTTYIKYTKYIKDENYELWTFWSITKWKLENVGFRNSNKQKHLLLFIFTSL